jgi:plasmid stability protein
MKKNPRYTRATVYFVPDIHKALRLRAAESGVSVSELVNEALKESLSDDAADLDAFLLQQDQMNVSFEQFICDLRRRGRL